MIIVMVAFAFFLVLAATFAIGWFFVRIFWSRGIGECLLLRSCLAWGFGSGILSILFFCHLVLMDGRHRAWLAPVAMASLVILILLQKGRWGSRCAEPRRPELGLRSPFVVILIVVLAAAAANFVLRSMTHPHGEGDAIAIWNYRARLLFESDQHWRGAFAAETSGHPDYPLLNAGYTALVWEALGVAYVPVLAVSAFAYYLGLAGILWSAVRLLHNRDAACISTIVLLSLPLIAANAASQLSDARLAFFLLSACVLSTMALRCRIADARLLVLTGFSLGLAAWTKNEGLLFCVAFFLAYAVDRRLRSGAMPWRELGAILCGATPVLLVVLWFKALVPANDLVAELSQGQVIERAFDMDRHLEILAAFWDHFSSAQPALYMALVVHLFVCKQKPDRRVLLVTLLIGVGYYVVFLVTSAQLTWHLSTAASRLISHLLPAVLFALFCSRAAGDSVGRGDPMASLST